MDLESNHVEMISSLVGDFKIVNEHRKNSNRTGVFEIIADNRNMFVKIHNRLSRWNPEVYAYNNWTLALEPFVPRLLHSFNKDNCFGIIISPVEGKTINEFQMKDENLLEKAYFKAGELLRLLHNKFEGSYFGIPSVDGSSFERNAKTSPVEYITSSFENTLRQGHDKELINDSDITLIDWCIENSVVFSDRKPVPTNWDYSPQNWMLDKKGNFTGIIDFEDMLWGIDYDSFGMVIERYTFDKLKLRKAMFEGYGMENGLKSQVEIRIMSAKLALADIVYGPSMNDTRIASLGRKLLDSLK